jgi:acetyl/propionyl-CoA carboxylase alpha subunit
MIQSLLIANRGEIACRIIRSQILPGTGRCPNGAEGSQAGHRAEQVESWDPSVASRHLPVPGRILG